MMIILPVHRSGIFFVPHSEYGFVHKDHDIIKLLIVRKSLYDVDIQRFRLVDDNYYKITRKTVESLCACMALPKIVRIQRWFFTTVSLQRRLAVVMALHFRLGRAHTPPPLGPVGMRVCRLGTLNEDLVIKILSISAFPRRYPLGINPPV
jgi:hypothetical protein